MVICGSGGCGGLVGNGNGEGGDIYDGVRLMVVVVGGVDDGE